MNKITTTTLRAETTFVRATQSRVGLESRRARMGKMEAAENGMGRSTLFHALMDDLEEKDCATDSRAQTTAPLAPKSFDGQKTTCPSYGGGAMVGYADNAFSPFYNNLTCCSS